jgi:hypothetical protein
MLASHGNGNLTTKIPLNYLNQTNGGFKGGNSVVHMVNGTPQTVVMGLMDKSHLSASQKKRISLKKLEEEYCKTLEQVGSPNVSSLNLENMKKTQSLHYMRAGSGASSPQQIKSRTSIGKYAAAASGAQQSHHPA